MPIPDAYTDQAPSAVVFEDRLYVAFKDKDSDQIRLASTATPNDPTSWETLDLTFYFPEPGPAEIRTLRAPALSVYGRRLWLVFKGHDNPHIWAVAMDADGEWRGYGYLPDAETHNDPAMAGNLVVHRGYPSNRVRYTFHSLALPVDREIPYTRCNSGPAVAYWPPGTSQPIVAYIYGIEIMTTKGGISPGISGYDWIAPAGKRPSAVLGSRASERPALAMHFDLMYLAYKFFHSTEIWLGTYNGRSWILHGAIPGCITAKGPALVSFYQTLYVVFQRATTDEVDYGPVPIPSIPEPLTVMTLNVRERKLSDRSPHRWSERLPRIVSMLQRYEDGQGPHIVGMQEVQRNQYHHLRDSLHTLDYLSVWAERGGPLFWNPLEGMALFYRPDRVELLEWGEFTITHSERRVRGGCPDSYVWGGDHSNRNIIWGRFRDLIAHRTFYVFNSHFGGGDWCELRGNALFMADNINSRSLRTDPIIAIGDFNMGEYAGHINEGETKDFDNEFIELLNNTGLENAYRRINSYYETEKFSTQNDDFSNMRWGKMIDFVLISAPPFQVSDADIDRTMFTRGGDPVNCYRIDHTGRCEDTTNLASYLRMYSDHWAVWASLGWFPE